jgi:hypothetical protein
MTDIPFKAITTVAGAVVDYLLNEKGQQILTWENQESIYSDLQTVLEWLRANNHDELHKAWPGLEEAF